MKLACPICKTSVESGENPDFPFCSERCRMKDLGNWAAERYVVSEPAFDEEELEDELKRPGDAADADE